MTLRQETFVTMKIATNDFFHRMFACTCIHVCTTMYVSFSVCACPRLCLCLCLSVCVCACVCVFMCVCTWLCVWECLNICACLKIIIFRIFKFVLYWKICYVEANTKTSKCNHCNKIWKPDWRAKEHQMFSLSFVRDIIVKRKYRGRTRIGPYNISWLVK